MKVSFTEHKTAEISEQEANKVAIARILKVCEIPESSFILDGNLIEREEHHTSHSWTTDEKIREATPLDYSALEIVKRLKNGAS